MAEPRVLEDLHPLLVPLDQLHVLPGNPRRGDVSAVARSLDTFGQRKPIVARRDGMIIAGNHTFQAAQLLGWPDLAVVWTDDTEEVAKAFALADNRTADLGSYDEEALLAYLDAVRRSDDEDLFTATGYSTEYLEQLLTRLTGPDTFTDLDPEQLAVEYRCPSCGYEWSGSPTPGATADP